MVTRHIVYTPGLGDVQDPGRRLALKLWRLYGAEAELIPMDWDDEKSYQPKYDRVVDAVSRATKKGQRVSLVADSAGAAIALNVFARHSKKIDRVVTICGVNSASILPLSPMIEKRNPALDNAIRKLPVVLPRIDTTRITSFTALWDLTVRPEHSYIKNAHNRRLPMVVHFLTISCALTIFAPWIVRAAIKKH